MKNSRRLARKFDRDQSERKSPEVQQTWPDQKESQVDQIFNLRLLASSFGQGFTWQEEISNCLRLTQIGFATH